MHQIFGYYVLRNLKLRFLKVLRKYDIVSVVPWLLGPPAVYIASVEMMREVVGHTTDFDKVAGNPGIA